MELFEENRKGTVLRIERSSIHDGDGFRTVIFLKGCPLCCQWCSTPESQSPHIEKTANKVYGVTMTVGEVLREIRKDSIFYFLSAGGVTLSGGEVLAQPEFSLALLKNCMREGINTAIETCLFSPWETVERLLPYVNTYYVDLKLIDRNLHRRYCGVDNTLILDNLLALDRLISRSRLIVRTPIIPGVNDSEVELNRIATFCSKFSHLEYIQLLPYHRLGTATYRELGRVYALEGLQPPTPEQMERCRSVIRSHLVKVI